MINEKILKIIKFIGISIILTLIYLAAAFLLLGLSSPGFSFSFLRFSKKDILMSSFLFFLLFICFYFFIFKNKRIVKYKFLQRIILYAFFFNFSAGTIFLILKSVMYHSSLIFPYGIIRIPEIVFLTARICFISYVIFTLIMEIQKNNKILKQLINWFIATVIACYIALLVLYFLFHYLYNDLAGLLGYIDYSFKYWLTPLTPELFIIYILTIFIISYLFLRKR